MGVYSLNSASAIGQSRDKLHALQRLLGNNLDIPVTGFAKSVYDPGDLVAMVGGSPLVLKLLEGTQGIGVVLAETKKAAESVVEAFMGLKANILIQGGIPENMDFDISGTSISLDNVRVHGESAQFDQDDWSAEFQLNKARTIWKKPVFLHAEAEAELKDSRPFVALFTNHKGKHKWIEKMLTVEDIQGTATMTLENQRLAIPHALTSSDRIDAGVKGIIDATQREGIFYVRHGRLDAAGGHGSSR